MKQSFTLENDLTMLIDLLSEMVENKNLTQKQMEQIMEKIFTRFKESIPDDLPSESTVNTILNYSRALTVLKPDNKASHALIIN